MGDAFRPPDGLAPEDENTPEYREWLAAAYETDVYDVWLRPFEELALRHLVPPAKGMLLEVGCSVGRGTEALLARLGDRTRLVAQEDRGFLLDRARARLTDRVGSRLFFNSDALPRLRYDAGVFAGLVSNVSWWERGDREALLGEMVRVLDAGGQIVLTAPLAGTFAELFDLLREVTVKLDLGARLDPILAAAEGRFVVGEDWAAGIASAGLTEVAVHSAETEVRFASSRELFSSVVAQARWIKLWRSLFGDEWERLAWHLRQMIDTYWSDARFPLTLVAGCLTARKPAEASRPAAAAPAAGREATPKPAPAPEARRDPTPRPAQAPRPAAPAREADEVPVVLDGGSGVVPSPSAPPPAAAPFFASGDDIAAALLGDGTDASARLTVPSEPPARAFAVPPPSAGPAFPSGPDEAEPLEAEPLEAEPLEAGREESDAELPTPADFPSEILLPDRPTAFDPLDEVEEPYVPDEGDLHSPSTEFPEPFRQDGETLMLDENEIVAETVEPPSAAAVRPVPLSSPSALPIAPVDLGRPRIAPLQPVDLGDPGVDEEDDDDWGR